MSVHLTAGDNDTPVAVLARYLPFWLMSKLVTGLAWPLSVVTSHGCLNSSFDPNLSFLTFVLAFDDLTSLGFFDSRNIDNNKYFSSKMNLIRLQSAINL